MLVKNAFDKSLSPAQTKSRDELERRVVELRRSKSSLDEADYYATLEALLLDLARICHAHPSLSEAVHDAAMAVHKRAIHKAN